MLQAAFAEGQRKSTKMKEEPGDFCGHYREIINSVVGFFSLFSSTKYFQNVLYKLSFLHN